MNQSNFSMLLQRYQQGECTPAEKQRIEQWYSRLGAEQPFNLTAAEKATLVATVWQRISDHTMPGLPVASTTKIKARTWPPMSVRWAAAVLLALGAGLVGTHLGLGPRGWATALQQKATAERPTMWRVYTNASAYEAQVALPDGSAVTLAPASSLKYPRTFDGPRRTVYLTGEAFFDVLHDAHHPFSVYTDRVVTTVLGTSFRVQAYAGQAEAQVQVRTGAVRVSSREAGADRAASLVVLPNQQAVYSGVRRQLRRELVAEPLLLKQQSFAFNDRPVAEVLAALEQSYGVTIEYDAAAVRSCTLTLNLSSEPLFTKLDIICEILGASYEKADGRIVFHNQPCQAE